VRERACECVREGEGDSGGVCVSVYVCVCWRGGGCVSECVYMKVKGRVNVYQNIHLYT
jgi:hypothetical protein